MSADSFWSPHGELDLVWRAAHQEKQLKERDVIDADLVAYIEAFLRHSPDVTNLRISGSVVTGLVRLFERKWHLFSKDVQQLLEQLRASAVRKQSTDKKNRPDAEPKTGGKGILAERGNAENHQRDFAANIGDLFGFQMEKPISPRTIAPPDTLRRQQRGTEIPERQILQDLTDQMEFDAFGGSFDDGFDAMGGFDDGIGELGLQMGFLGGTQQFNTQTQQRDQGTPAANLKQKAKAPAQKEKDVLKDLTDKDSINMYSETGGGELFDGGADENSPPDDAPFPQIPGGGGGGEGVSPDPYSHFGAWADDIMDRSADPTNRNPFGGRHGGKRDRNPEEEPADPPINFNAPKKQRKYEVDPPDSIYLPLATLQHWQTKEMRKKHLRPQECPVLHVPLLPTFPAFIPSLPPRLRSLLNLMGDVDAAISAERPQVYDDPYPPPQVFDEDGDDPGAFASPNDDGGFLTGGGDSPFQATYTYEPPADDHEEGLGLPGTVRTERMESQSQSLNQIVARGTDALVPRRSRHHSSASAAACESEANRTGFSARTEKMLMFLQREQQKEKERGGGDSVSFKCVCEGKSRDVVAAVFSEVLFLKTKGFLQVEQEEPFADIFVTPLE
uniref:Rad21/Rec8-like protein C-terminal eukaryotic domain-containing protein n=1 Tax=Chromera velia CCMP2878 TaxID=1169474 RepID=A0A0G4GT46_9ALVE|eukprot:Cvel_5178.t1-p1 / transcript=Cvel_5178.t1 / gene=Cvel_5178 / organism=Chromera_velia_CCMP2878 / gene_product=Sister chromatid cohesion 1 protein 2, putative / transcript_product=Sister chromatid cohesion 1 protein 2, putative / location=Cvel_scaffold237:100362-102508(+) / protein_length=614 / sequence_SO=supercontig / SO=protein_coding / is_pseudo=false